MNVNRFIRNIICIKIKSLAKDGFDERLKYLKEHPGYPKHINEHNALADAQWNFRLWNFLNLY
jgi:hypothetical protein